MMRRLLAIVALLVSLLAVSSSAVATVDTGAQASLVALVGEGPELGLFADLNVGGEGECMQLYLVDLGKDTFDRLHVDDCFGEDPDAYELNEATIRAYLQRAPESLRERVADASIELVDPEEVKAYERYFDEDTVDFVLRAPPGLTRFAPHLRVNTRLPSMAAVERHSREPCVSGGEFRCPGCRELERTIDGETFNTYVCDGPATEECDCRAQGATVRFVMVDHEKSRRFLGNRLYISPYRLLQNQVGQVVYAVGQPAMGLRSGSIQSLQALVLDERIIFWGTAADAPTQNGTWFPLVAVVQRGNRDDQDH